MKPLRHCVILLAQLIVILENNTTPNKVTQTAIIMWYGARQACWGIGGALSRQNFSNPVSLLVSGIGNLFSNLTALNEHSFLETPWLFYVAFWPWLNIFFSFYHFISHLMHAVLWIFLNIIVFCVSNLLVLWKHKNPNISSSETDWPNLQILQSIFYFKYVGQNSPSHLL